MMVMMIPWLLSLHHKSHLTLSPYHMGISLLIDNHDIIQLYVKELIDRL